MPNARYALPFYCPHCPHQLTVIGGTVGRGFADTYLRCDFCHAEFKAPTIELEPRNVAGSASAEPSLLDKLRAAKLELLTLEIEEKRRALKPTDVEPAKYLTVAELATKLGRTRETVLAYRRRGLIAYVQRRPMLFDLEAVQLALKPRGW